VSRPRAVGAGLASAATVRADRRCRSTTDVAHRARPTPRRTCRPAPGTGKIRDEASGAGSARRGCAAGSTDTREQTHQIGADVEFGIFLQMFLPRASAFDPAAEHQQVLNELELVREADAHNWKYVWVAEHHCLTEYSHLSASESFIPFALAQTRRIHIGSGIWPTNPQQNHPIRLAERAAMCDHLSEGRFEFGTGRGAGSHEVGSFMVKPADTKAVWDEVIWEFKKMWESWDYSHEGPAFTVPPRNVLPKPYGGGKTHPPMWVAAGNLPTYEKAARHGLGVLGFNVAAIFEMREHVRSYKDAISAATPVGQYVNDNVMVANALVCLEDGRRARELACNMQLSYLQSLTFLYHDSFPMPEGFTRWPGHIPEPTMEDIEQRIEAGFLLCGDPDEVTEQLHRYEEVGCDQVSFGLPLGMPQELALETIRLFGDEVIPKFDKDPVHRSTRMRNGEHPLDK
jgi:alkanesulfonate monooxygenase SsuD/methylene tetrahydromethanopterin reductase-like flavin-dependent oxidoreductase (luciferase family)